MLGAGINFWNVKKDFDGLASKVYQDQFQKKFPTFYWRKQLLPTV